jgi:hypothetical protein
MNSGDRIEVVTTPDKMLYKKRGVIVSTSVHLVHLKIDGMDYQFSLSRSEVRVLSAVEHLAEKAE